MWIHINFWFRNKKNSHRYLSPTQYKKFLKYIGELLGGFQDYFFLFELRPHCFLAVRTNPLTYLILIPRVNRVPKPNFIKYAILELDSEDDINGWEHFTKAMSAYTRMLMTKNHPFPRRLKFFPKRQRPIAHLVHCMLNEATSSRKEEREFYKQMLKYYKHHRASESKNGFKL